MRSASSFCKEMLVYKEEAGSSDIFGGGLIADEIRADWACSLVCG